VAAARVRAGWELARVASPLVVAQADTVLASSMAVAVFRARFFAAVLSGPSFLARALEGLAVALPVGFGRALVRALLLLAGFAAPSWFALARAL
jgi:hypothetical protein